MKKGIEIWTGYDPNGVPYTCIGKQRGKLTLEKIQETLTEYDQNFYLLVIKAMDQDLDQYYDVDDLNGDYVECYTADKFFEWREKA